MPVSLLPVVRRANREVSPDALQIPLLAVEVGTTKPRRRKPVPAPNRSVPLRARQCPP